MKTCPAERMHGAVCRALTLAIFLAAFTLTSFAQVILPKILRVEIKPAGPLTVSDEFVRANVRCKPGDPYLRAHADDDVRNLYATGLFHNIRIVEDNTSDGVVLIYVVQARPKLYGIQFTGNTKYSSSKLGKKIESKVDTLLDERKLFSDSKTIEKLYEKDGYTGTGVKYSLSIDEQAGRATATFEVTEKQKVKIKRVEFVGAKAFSQKELRKTIKTRNRWMFSWITGSGIFKEEQFEEDREKLAQFYRERGYIDFQILGVKLETVSDRHIVVKITVEEGIPYKVGSVVFKDAPMLPTNNLPKVLKLHPGQTFTPDNLSKDITKVEDFYGAKGHIDVTASSRNLRVMKIPNVEEGTMDLEYRVTEGQQSLIEKIEIRGNSRTKDRVIRRELTVAPGEVFDMVRVKFSKQRIEGLQYFDKVDARPEQTDIPNRRNLVISVEERSTGRVQLGAGFNSVDSVVGRVEFTQGNFDLGNPPFFTGGGQKFRTLIQVGSEREDYTMSFIEPWFTGRKLSFGVDLFRRVMSYQSLENLYNEERTGGRVSLSRALGSDFLIGGVSFTPEDVGIVDVSTNSPHSITNEAGHSFLSRFGASLAYDTRNNSMLPTKGQRTELLGEVTVGEREFFKFEVRTGWYFKGLLTGDVIEVIGRTGVADSFGSTDEVPFYDRYYLGGLYSLRGYRYREIGPREPLQNGLSYEPVGGCTYWFGCIEYSTPLFERLRFAVFYDIGMVYPGSFRYAPEPSRGVGFDTGSYADNWGVGLRLNLPIGPLRLDYGIPIKAPPGVSDGGRFQFGAGYTRDF